MSADDIRQIREQLNKIEEKLDAQADLKWRVIAHEVIAGAVVAILGLAAAFLSLWPGSKP